MNGGGTNNLPVCRIPYPDTGVQAACRDLFPVKSDGVNLTEVARERPQALALRDTPNLRGGIVGAGYNNVTMDLETPYTSLMANEYVLAETLFEVPYPESRVARARYGSIGI